MYSVSVLHEYLVPTYLLFNIELCIVCIWILRRNYYYYVQRKKKIKPNCSVTSAIHLAYIIIHQNIVMILEYRSSKENRLV